MAHVHDFQLAYHNVTTGVKRYRCECGETQDGPKEAPAPEPTPEPKAKE